MVRKPFGITTPRATSVMPVTVNELVVNVTLAVVKLFSIVKFEIVLFPPMIVQLVVPYKLKVRPLSVIIDVVLKVTFPLIKILPPEVELKTNEPVP